MPFRPGCASHHRAPLALLLLLLVQLMLMLMLMLAACSALDMSADRSMMALAVGDWFQSVSTDCTAWRTALAGTTSFHSQHARLFEDFLRHVDNFVWQKLFLPISLTRSLSLSFSLLLSPFSFFKFIYLLLKLCWCNGEVIFLTLNNWHSPSSFRVGRTRVCRQQQLLNLIWTLILQDSYEVFKNIVFLL